MKTKMYLSILFLLAISGLEQATSQEEDFPFIWSKNLPNTIGLSNLFFSHDSKKLFCYKGAKQNVIIFDIPSGELIDDQKVFDLSQPILSNDDSHLYGISGNHIAYYNIETGIDESIFEPGDTTFDIYDVSMDENYIVTADKKSLKLWDAKTGKVLRAKKLNIELKDLWSIQHTIKISCDNTKIYFQSLYGYVDYFNNSWSIKQFVVYDFNTLDSIYNFDFGNYNFYLSDDCKYLAGKFVSSIDKKEYLKIFNTETNQIVNNIGENIPVIRQAYFTSDNRYLIASCFNDGILMWNVLTGDKTKITKGGPTAMGISFDQKYLAGNSAYILGLINISKTTGVKEPNEIYDILYPNPSTGEIIIEIPENSPENLVLLDINGIELRKFDKSSILTFDNQIRLNLSEYHSGIYFLQISYTSFTNTYKIIINK